MRRRSLASRGTRRFDSGMTRILLLLALAAVVAVSGTKRPEAGDHDVLAIGIGEGSQPLTAAGVVGIDLTVAEVADQQCLAERAEGVGRNREPPGRVQGSAFDEAGHQPALERKDIDVAVACSGHVVGCTCDIDWDELAERKAGAR